LENPTKPEFNGQLKESGKKIFFRNLFEIAQMLAMAFVLYFIIDSMVGRVRVQKISMEPTLEPGEILLVNKLEYKFGEIERGDIVTFHYPLDPTLDYVKRVIGLPGDRVVVKNSQVWVNGQELYEPYISAPPEYEGVWEVPDDNLFLLGDNRNPSADSHVWGFVPRENLIGKAFAVYWPVTKIRGLPTPDIFALGNY
jgi:signal peptidase I